MPVRKLLDDVEGDVRFHHITPDLRVLDARRCAHQWVVYHDTYCFCLPLRVSPPVQWRYNHRLYVADGGHAMALQPGELHANVVRTPPVDFIVVFVSDTLMKQVARDLGWRHAGINFNYPHPGSDDPELLAALHRFQQGLCHDLFDPRRLDGGICTCWRSFARHQENLAYLVAAVLERCAEGTRKLTLPSRGSAAIVKALDHLREYYDEPYDLDRLAEVAGCNRYYLAHAFTREVGVPPSEYQNRILVAKACQVLATSPDKALDAVAQAVGWPGRPSQRLDDGPDSCEKTAIFIKHFRRTMGTTPGMFRASLRRMSAADRRRFGRAALEVGEMPARGPGAPVLAPQSIRPTRAGRR
jgi:AraC-like DNA-binding protein